MPAQEEIPEEIEVKFPVSEWGSLRNRLIQTGAQVCTPRHLERNWRLDTPSGDLTASGRVLRVRQGDVSTLTFKARTQQAMTRREIEIEVASFSRTLELFEGLGYNVIFIYEKYREVFELDGVQIMLDELPYGRFVEVEGPDQDSLVTTASRLGLTWAAGVDTSYMELFDRMCATCEATPPNLTFSDFESLDLDAILLLNLKDALGSSGKME